MDERTKITIERIKAAREKKGMSYQDVSDITGFSKSVLQRYETGAVKKIPVDRLEKIALALSVPPEWLMGYDTTNRHDISFSLVGSLTDHETAVITAYRNKPELQPAVDKLLDVPEEKQEVLVAARNGGLKKRPITDDEQRIIKEDSQVSEEL